MSVALECHLPFWSVSVSLDSFNYFRIIQQRLPSLVTRRMQINIQYNVVLRHEVLIGVSLRKQCRSKTFFFSFVLFRFSLFILDLVKITFPCHIKKGLLCWKPLVRAVKPVQKFCFDIYVRKNLHHIARPRTMIHQQTLGSLSVRSEKNGIQRQMGHSWWVLKEINIFLFFSVDNSQIIESSIINKHEGTEEKKKIALKSFYIWPKENFKWFRVWKYFFTLDLGDGR